MPIISAIRSVGTMSPMGGHKGEAAKPPIKGAIRNLSRIGRKSWDKAVFKLPMPGAVKKYLSYEAVMNALNITVNFEGTVEGSNADSFKKARVPGRAVGIATRAIVTIIRQAEGMWKSPILYSFYGTALPLTALFAYSGSGLDDNNVAAVPLIALSALFAVEIVQRGDKGRESAKVFSVSLILSCATIALVRAFI